MRVQRLVDCPPGWHLTLDLRKERLLNSVSGKGTPHIDLPVQLPPIPAQ